jgi:hypothetical protein
MAYSNIIPDAPNMTSFLPSPSGKTISSWPDLGLGLMTLVMNQLAVRTTNNPAMVFVLVN